MLCKLLLAYDKLKFCLLELAGNFFLNIFHPWLFESIDVEPLDMEG